MPGYILHLTAARIYLDQLAETDPLRRDRKKQNDFFAGNLIPDTSKNKSVSHFWNPLYRDRMIEWPCPEKFREKYAALMHVPSVKGYYFHLYIDKMFLRDYLPEVAEYYRRDGSITERKEEVEYVMLKKSGEKIPLVRYLSDEYYYGDYTKMNTWLKKRFLLPEKLEAVENPGIREVDFRNLSGIMEELAQYDRVTGEAVQSMKVFDAEGLTGFLYDTVRTMSEHI